MSGGDYIHAGIVVDKLEGEHEMTLGSIGLIRDDLRIEALIFIFLTPYLNLVSIP